MFNRMMHSQSWSIPLLSAKPKTEDVRRRARGPQQPADFAIRYVINDGLVYIEPEPKVPPQ